MIYTCYIIHQVRNWFIVLRIAVRRFLRLCIILPIFLWPQLKRSVVNSKKNGVYKLPQRLLNEFSLTIKTFQENIETSSNYNLVLSFTKTLKKSSTNSSFSTLFNRKSKVSLKYIVDACSINLSFLKWFRYVLCFSFIFSIIIFSFFHPFSKTTFTDVIIVS